MKSMWQILHIEHIEQKEHLLTTIFLSVYKGCKTLFFQFYLFAQVLSRYIAIVYRYERNLATTGKIRLIQYKHSQRNKEIAEASFGRN